MADYVSVLTRAVAGKATYEERRAVYERARQALVAQLRGIDPPLPEGDITRQRLGLEEAIRKVEADAAATQAAARAPAPVPPAPAPVPPAPAPVVEAAPAPRREPDPAPVEPPAAPEPPRPSPLGTVAKAAEALGEASEKTARVAREQFGAPIPPAPPAGARMAEPRLGPLPPIPPARPLPEPVAAPAPLPEPTVAAPLPEPPPLEPSAADSSLTRVRALPGTIYQEPTESRRGLVAGIVVAVLLLVCGVGIWLISDRLFPAGGNGQTAGGGATAFQPGKATDRIAPDGARTGQPAAAVQAQAFLYEDNVDNPRGVEGFRGRVAWRIDTDTNRQGQGPERVIRGLVEIPDRNMRLLISIRRNSDPALPASHTIELLFETPQDFVHGAVDGIPGVRMKPSEQAQGLQLVGPTVRITAGYFLTGLSALGTAREQNVILLRDRPWLDIPLVYRNGRLAVLAIEKGVTGEQVFQEAFRGWGG